MISLLAVLGFVPLAVDPTAQPINDYGTVNKICCTTTITSRQIKSALAERAAEEANFPRYFIVQSTLGENGDDLKMDEFPPDSLFGQSPPEFSAVKYGIWTNTFSEWSSQAAVPNQSAFHYHICGMGVGMNYFGFESCAIGTGLLYDHVYLVQDQNLGSQEVNYALATFYASFPIGRFSINLAATGGFLFFKTKSPLFYPDFTGVATAEFPGYQVMPHLDMNYDFDISNLSFSPFYQIDWSFNVQSSFREKGAGNYALYQSALKASLLRQEIGMNFFETWDLEEKGLIVFRQKGSYVRLIPFQHGSTTANTVATGLFSVWIPVGAQNFGSCAGEIRYQKNAQNFLATFEGFYGSGFINNAFYLTYSLGF